MTKEQAKAYSEILDNLKRDLADDEQEKRIRAEVAEEIGKKLSTFASGVYMKGEDELIVIPMSSLKHILKDYKLQPKTDCRGCKHFILCNIDKQSFYIHTGEECPEYKEVSDGKDRI